MITPAPFARSYWVLPGIFIAGCYPGARDNVNAEEQLVPIIESGVRTFINLMEEGERDVYGNYFTPYMPVAESIAERMGVTVEMKRFPIADLGVPDDGLMEDILSEIDRSIETDRPVYLHCLGGRGRTGAVVCCWLLEKKLADHTNVFDTIKDLRRDVALAGPSPESLVQLQYVNNWKRQ